MTIALIAHDSKKELMVQFCTAYCRILSQHKLVATGTTGKLISEATGLQIQRFLAGVQGGDQQIASRIACNEVDLLLFFRRSPRSGAWRSGLAGYRPPAELKTGIKHKPPHVGRKTNVRGLFCIPVMVTGT